MRSEPDTGVDESGLHDNSEHNGNMHDGSDQDGVSPLSMLSNQMVRIYKEKFGRGPTRARSSFAGPNTVVCLLENTFTPAEKNLQSMGEHQRLRDMRMFFQYTSAGDFTNAVEQTLGRRVESFISGIDTNTDVACEVFTLAPSTGD
ncbi:MAG TPA: Na-translocating system protein MpsC family protein [Solirubrobacteraceae bacterium]|nr:Na-translocating system protein MpsC family protein [Solirubrobacteraceae bacterium]